MHEHSVSKKRDFFLDLLIEDKYRAARHGLIIFLIMGCFFVMGAFKEEKEFNGNHDLWLSLVMGITLLGLLYGNLYILMDRILARKRYIVYFFSTFLLMLAVFTFLKIYAVFISDPHRINKTDRVPAILEFVVFCVVVIPPLLCSSALKLFQMWTRETNRIAALEKRAHESELDALRNQINPHFLFNMLNNINTLIDTRPETASQIVVKLSDFLRYLLYENNHQNVFLTSEIKFLTDFVNLESIRRDNFNYEIITDSNCSKGIQVPPNIFITFVENAVKHSRDTTNPTFVKITFAAIGNTLQFSVSNTKPKFNKSDRAGLGLINISRRLELLYGDRFQLEVLENDSTYTVNLNLPI